MSDQDMTRFRRLFPICEHTAYLESCSCGALAQPVSRAVEHFLDDWNRRGPQWEEEWYGAVIEAERLFAQLYHVHERQVVLLPNVTSALIAVASAFHSRTLADFAGRRRMLIPVGEFPTTGHLWTKQPGLEVVGIPAEADDLTPYLDEQTLLLCLSHVCYSTGRRRNLGLLTEQAHAAGALVLVDDSQSAGTRRLDASALGIDFLVASGHKYLLGSVGGGAMLLVRAGVLARLHPTMSGWAAHRDFVRSIQEQHGRLRIEPGDQGWNPFAFEEAEDAWKFAGGTANVLHAYTARAGLRLLLEAGIEAIEQHVERLVAHCITCCEAQGIALKTPRAPDQHGPMVVLRTPEPDHLKTVLAERHIKVSPRGADGVRVSFHVYNNRSDVGHLMQALAANRWLVAAA
jgi:selenocysteine lyase/cysteine desulfurase